MTFLQPLLLWGLLAIAIPVIIHFINFRKPEKLQFSSLMMLEILQESIVKRLKLKSLLLLFLRILIICALVVALSQPVIELSGTSVTKEGGYFVMIIDNSPSMSRIDENGPYLYQSLTLAEQIIISAGEKSRFIIIKTNGEPLPVGWRKGDEAKGILSDITVEVKASSLLSTLQLAVRETEMLLKGTKVYWFTDFQKNEIELITDNLLKTDAYSTWNIIMVETGNDQLNNVSIDSVRIAGNTISPEAEIQIEVEVTNFGSDPVSNHYLELYSDNELMGQYQISIPPYESIVKPFSVRVDAGSFLNLNMKLDGDPVTFDNSYYAVVELPENKSVLIITPEKSELDSEFAYLNALTDASAGFSDNIRFVQKTISSIAGVNLEQYDAYVLAGLRDIPAFLGQRLLTNIQNGKGLLVYPTSNLNMESYNTFFQTLRAGFIRGVLGDFGSFNPVDAISKPRLEHPVFAEMFENISKDNRFSIDKLSIYYMLQYQFSERGFSRAILSSDLKRPIITEHQLGNGQILIFSLAPSISWSSLPTNRLFAPLLYQAIRYISRTGNSIIKSVDLSSNMNLDVFSDNGMLEVVDPDGETIKPIITPMGKIKRLSFQSVFWNPGFVEIIGENEKKRFGVNINRSESNFEKISVEELESLLLKSVNSISIYRNNASEKQNRNVILSGFGKEIWFYFIILSLLLLVTELLVDRFYKIDD